MVQKKSVDPETFGFVCEFVANLEERAFDFATQTIFIHCCLFFLKKNDLAGRKYYADVNRALQSVLMSERQLAEELV
jgi:hypothetical protein